ncbi:S8 family serine peptidase [Pseudalkalibacillus sp. R45]|uniref:S8 family serine peptidase n=1 Tax=Pseudalkalibacillus sp. R45 TaxID=3457433 RepID=UPI003FCD0A99
MNNFKKSVTLLFIFLLAFSNLSFAATPNMNNGSQSSENATTKEEALDTVKADLPFKANDQVRVIVELDGKAAIELAKEKGTNYSKLAKPSQKVLQEKVTTGQKQVKQSIADQKVNINYKFNFTTVVNGFSGEVQYSEIKNIEKLPGVKDVYLSNEYERPIVEPNMVTSHEFIQSYKAWTEGTYKGEGMVVSVIDSGVDPSHKDFILSPETDADLSESEVNSLKEEHDLSGTYFTEKVPYGYNYFDRNTKIRDLVPDGSNHGMHVAGIVGANGNPDDGGIKGVAPESQLLAMKVFSNDPGYSSTFSDVYIAAIDDSIKLGADAINMSLGSVAAFYSPDDVANLAITRAVDNGVVVSVSAGNSRHIGDPVKTPFAENPDIGVVGAPGLSYDSIQVAASGNKQTWYNYNLSLNGNPIDGFGYSSDDWFEKLGDQEYEIVSLGSKYGSEADYEGIDVSGKIVAVSRGGSPAPFIDKAAVAAEQGAVGIIVVDTGAGGTIYRDQGHFDIPFMLTTKETGDQLKNLYNDGNTSLNFEVDTAEPSPQQGRPTSFSSWGSTPSLDLKPEIMAPGGNIYSTLNDDEYGWMSGTSMAAPHVAGGSALVMEYIKEHEDYKNLSSSEQAHLAKTLLMNTAEVVKGTNGHAFSPRLQGAGQMQIHNATITPVRVVDPNTNEAKVELRDFVEETVNFKVEAINDSDDKDVTYEVNVDVLTDAIQRTEEGDLNWSAAVEAEGNPHLRGGEPLKNVSVDAPETVTVPAGESVEIQVSIDLTDARIPGYNEDGSPNEDGFDLKEDIFIEGFVRLEDVDGEEANLVVPYLGFYGDWDRPSIIDGLNHIDDKFFYEFCWGNPCAGLYHKPGKDGYLGWDPINGFEDAVSKYAISPNGDGVYDIVTPMVTFLRNASDVQYNILDEDKNKIRTLRNEKNVRKHYASCFCRRDTGYLAERGWDGKVNGEVVPDGKYYFEIKARVDMKHREADWQSKKIPFVVDTIQPEVSADYDIATKKLTWEANDSEGIGLSHFLIKVDGENVLPEDTFLPSDAREYDLSEVDVPNGVEVEVVAYDFSQNLTEQEADLVASGDETDPVVILQAPSSGTILTTKTINLRGFVRDKSPLEAVYVNGESVEFNRVIEFDEERYRFDTELTVEEDDVYEIAVKAVDIAGNETEFRRRPIFVDTTPATISVDAPAAVQHSVTSTQLDIHVQDNYDFIRVYVNDDEIEYNPGPSSFEHPVPLDLNLEEEVNLQEGNNTFTIRTVDLAGATTTQTVNIYRLREGESSIIDETSVTPEKITNTKKPVSISATATEPITWSVKLVTPSGDEVELPAVTGKRYRENYKLGKNAESGTYKVVFSGITNQDDDVAQVEEGFIVED